MMKSYRPLILAGSLATVLLGGFTLDLSTGPLPTKPETQALAGSLGVDESPVGPHRKRAAIELLISPLTIQDGRLRAKAARPGDWRRELELGEAALEQGRKIMALGHFIRAHLAAPAAQEPLFPLARTLRRAHRPDFAEATLRLLIDLQEAESKDFRGTREPRRELASLLASSGRHRQAADLLRELLDEGSPLARSKGDGDLFARLAVQHYYLGEIEDAELNLKEARRLGGRIPAHLLPLLSNRTLRQRAELVSIDATAPVRVDAGGATQAAETSIAGEGSIFVAAWNDQRAGAGPGPGSGTWRLGTALSLDGGATWSEGLIRPPGATEQDFEGDPISAYDPRTGNAWVGGVSFFNGGSLYVARKRPGQSFFDPPVEASNDPDLIYDKPLLTAGPAPGAPDQTRLYLVFSEGLQSSSDLGQSWSELVPLGTVLEEVIYQPRVDDAGLLSIVSWDSAEHLWLRRSEDGGATVGPRRLVATRMDVWGLQDSSRVAGDFRTPPLPSLAVAGDGTLFVAFCDSTSRSDRGFNLDIYLTRSDDGGFSWSTPHVVHGDGDPDGDQFAPWIEIDQDGRLHVLFFDTRYQPQADGPGSGLVDVSYAYSDDGGESFFESRLTAVSFSSADAVWRGNGGSDYQFLGDYLGLALTGNGAVIALYPMAVGGDLDIFAQRLEPPRP